MKSVQLVIKTTAFSKDDLSSLKSLDPQIIFAFGSVTFFQSQDFVKKIRSEIPGASIIGCSAAGEISSQGVDDRFLVLTAVRFEQTKVLCAHENIENEKDSEVAAKTLGGRLKTKELKSIFILGPGTGSDGSAIIKGVREGAGKMVLVTGGLAGDQAKFEQTFTVSNDSISDHQLVAVGFYGNHLKTGYGADAGLDPHGQAKIVTRSEGNIIFELDGKPAVDLFGAHLGDHASNMPAAGYLFPLALLDETENDRETVIIVTSLNETDGSVTVTNAVPVGAVVRLAHAKRKNLIDGAQSAARHAEKILDGEDREGSVAILVSCIGRKLVLGDDVEEEVDSLRDILKNRQLAGFYSYGQIAPSLGGTRAKFHNQTMCITILSES